MLQSAYKKRNKNLVVRQWRLWRLIKLGWIIYPNKIYFISQLNQINQLNQLKLHRHLNLDVKWSWEYLMEVRILRILEKVSQNVQCLTWSGEVSQPWGAPRGSILTQGETGRVPDCSPAAVRRSSATDPPAGLHSNTAKSHLGSNVVTLVLIDPGACPSAPQQPPCRRDGVGLHGGVSHRSPPGEPWSPLGKWACHRPPACEEGCPSVPMACKPFFLCFPVPYCLAAVPKIAK